MVFDNGEVFLMSLMVIRVELYCIFPVARDNFRENPGTT